MPEGLRPPPPLYPHSSLPHKRDAERNLPKVIASHHIHNSKESRSIVIYNQIRPSYPRISIHYYPNLITILQIRWKLTSYESPAHKLSWYLEMWKIRIMHHQWFIRIQHHQWDEICNHRIIGGLHTPSIVWGFFMPNSSLRTIQKGYLSESLW